ncbi:hypothetical protein SDC9_60536 [bioreactor metagenome]|uniref:PD-(D/E)XK endonuclease-like domain-containing protein n=1 Tax=bioreactor metagenome TaxID=1076179 RepID=A0A644XD66_9ZZZZ
MQKTQTTVDNSFVLDGIRWSYSSVNSYHQCPRQFKLSYIDALPRVDNAFSDWGSFMHYLLEQYFKGKLEFFELSQLYVRDYKKNIKCTFPPNKYVNLNESYYNKGKEYLDNFDGDFDDCEVLAVEQKVKLDINGRPFVGVIDLVLKKPDGSICITDHKSKSKMKNKTELTEYLRQLYLYSLWVKRQYGEYPSELIFNMFRAGNKIVHSFVEDELNAAVEWFTATIDSIYRDTEFVAKSDSFFCNHLCGVRHHCSYSDDYDGEE